jgi:hypothetical protein
MIGSDPALDHLSVMGSQWSAILVDADNHTPQRTIVWRSACLHDLDKRQGWQKPALLGISVSLSELLVKRDPIQSGL